MNLAEAMQFGAGALAAAGVENARYDADRLLGFVLGWTRDRLYLKRERELTGSEVAHYQELVRRRATREPLQYILRRQQFMGLDFYVDPRVLIPRPDSEVLVEKLLDLAGSTHPNAWGADPHARSGARSDSEKRVESDSEARKRSCTRASCLELRTSIRVLDLCTGSGALAIAIARFLPGAFVVGSDISSEALTVARLNAERLGVAVEWRAGDFLRPAQGERWDWIISNPPYVSPADYARCAPEVFHEPVHALLGGPDGLDFYRRLAAGVRPLLTGRGGVLVEIGWDQADPVRTMFADQGFATTVFLDLGGRDRVILAV